MPLIKHSQYKAPAHLFNGHIETIIPSTFRKIEGIAYQRERIELADGDFLDLDWLNSSSRKLMIFSHGLEGSSERHYSKGMAKYFFQRGWDAMVWNCRGCSGEMNRLPRFYHHGATEDLQAVIQAAVQRNQYDSIFLSGVSMGGSMTVKYLGENPSQVPPTVKGAAVFSVPCDLPSSAKELDKPAQKLYRVRFLKKLGKKIKSKSEQFPDIVSYKNFESIKLIREFDNRYTAPLHGFKDADDFYQKASPLPYIPQIQIPTLIVNALNDPFLGKACYPYDLLKNIPNVFLETPARGGHTGFSLRDKEETFMETRAYEFLSGI